MTVDGKRLHEKRKETPRNDVDWRSVSLSARKEERDVCWRSISPSVRLRLKLHFNVRFDIVIGYPVGCLVLSYEKGA